MAVRTAVISDLHLGALNDADMLRRPGALERLSGALEGADRVVLLGDTLELRERPVAALLELVRPAVRAARPGARGQARHAGAGQSRPPARPALARPRAGGRPAARLGERVAGDRRARPTAPPACWPRGCRAARSRSPTRACASRAACTPPTASTSTSISPSRGSSRSRPRSSRRVAGRTDECASADDFEAVVAPDLRLPRGHGRGRDRGRAGARRDGVALGLEPRPPGTGGWAGCWSGASRSRRRWPRSTGSRSARSARR